MNYVWSVLVGGQPDVLCVFFVLSESARAQGVLYVDGWEDRKFCSVDCVDSRHMYGVFHN